MFRASIQCLSPFAPSLPTSPYPSCSNDQSDDAVVLCLCIDGFMCGVCLVLVIPHLSITKTCLYNLTPLNPTFI